MNREVIPINGYVTEVVVDTDPDRTTVTVNGPASVHTRILPNPDWTSVAVRDRIVIVRSGGDEPDVFVHDWLAELGDRVRKAGGVCVVFVHPEWQVTSETIDDLIRQMPPVEPG